MLNKQSWIPLKEIKNRVYKIVPNKYLALKNTTAKILKRKRKPHWTGSMANRGDRWLRKPEDKSIESIHLCKNKNKK